MSWGLVAVAGATVVGGVLGSKSAGKAASAQGEATEATIAEQRRQFDITQGNLQPFQEAGSAAVTEQQNLLGLSGQEAQQSSFDALNQSPGQKFLRDRAQKNLVRNASAIGGLGGGNVRSALVEQGVGFAQQDLQNQFGRLGQVAGQGQSAATSISQFGQQAAGNIGNALIAGGNARATGIFNQNQAVQQGISGLATVAGQSGIFNSNTSSPQTLPASNINPFARTA